MPTTPRKETLSDLVASLEAKLNTAQQANAALTADRKRMEAEIHRLKAIVDLRDVPVDARITSHQAMADSEVHRACNRRELELTTNPLEMKVAVKYWQDKYEELKRLSDIERKVAADQVASLQGKLEAAKQTIANCDKDHAELAKLNEHWRERANAMRDISVKQESQLKCQASDVAELKKELEIHQRATAIYDRDIADLRAKLELARRDLCTSNAPSVPEELNDLRRWKYEMLQVLSNLNLQEIGKVLDMPLGIDVSKNILPYIHSLKARLEGAEARARQEAEENLCGAVGYPHYSNTPSFKDAIFNLGVEILRINTDNGWDVTKPSDWPTVKGAPDDLNTNRLRKIGTNLALIHSEVSEALEAIRKLDRQNFEEEMADVVIRVLDTTHGLGINLAPVIEAKLEKNRGRGHKHGGKAI